MSDNIALSIWNKRPLHIRFWGWVQRNLPLSAWHKFSIFNDKIMPWVLNEVLNEGLSQLKDNDHSCSESETQ